MCTCLMIVQPRGTSQGILQVICCLNRRLRRFSQMGYDAPLPFVPGLWVPACAGMTVGVRGMEGRLHPHPEPSPINLPLEGEGMLAGMIGGIPRPLFFSVPGFWVPAPVSRERGFKPRVLCFSLGSRLRGNDGGEGEGMLWQTPAWASPADCLRSFGLVSVAWAPFALGKGRCRLNRRLRRFSQMGYDARRLFVPGFWVPACAGMTPRR